MKRTLVLILATVATVAFAKDKKDPANYPQIAHVLSSNGATAAFTTDAFTVKFQVGNLIYSCGYGCRQHVQVGTNVHVRVEKRFLYVLTDDGETCRTNIEGVQEK